MRRNAPGAPTAEWHRQRAVQEAEDPDPLDLAFSTFFLNRTSRSGIITGGIIGGKDQTGPWKLDARYEKKDLIQRIRKIARYRGRISLTRLDGAEYIREVLPSIDNGLVYLDPPYFTKGKGLYENFYRSEDHAEIARLVRKIKRQHWLVSYDAVPEIMKLYKGFRKKAYTLNYSAQDRYNGKEVMFFSPQLIVPRVATPAGISCDEVKEAKRLTVAMT